MDDLDRKMVILLQHDPRMTYREMSERLGVSTPTAQRRVENLFGSGRLRSIRYRIDVETLGGRWIFINGQARVKLTPTVIAGLQELGTISRVIQSAYNYVVCFVDVRDQKDIDETKAFVEHQLEPLETLVLAPRQSRRSGGLVQYRKERMQSGPAGDIDLLTRTDLKIIGQLMLDGRKTVASIASETGISSRTIKRRIDLLLKNNLIEPEVDWQFGIGDDVWLGMMARLADPSMKDDFFRQLARFNGHMFTSGWDYVNHPHLITFDGLFRSQSEIHEVVSAIAQFQGVEETNNSVHRMSCNFDTWVHRISRGEEPLPDRRPRLELEKGKAVT